MFVLDIDLSDPDLFARGDPHAVWRRLRAEAPVHFHPHPKGPGFWVITKHADVVQLSSDRRLSSAGGTTTLGDAQGLEAEILVVTDPPRHTVQRGLVNKAFTPRVVAALEPYVRRTVADLIDTGLRAGGFDFVSDVAARLPFTVICELLGVAPDERRSLFGAIGHLMETRADLAPGQDPNVAWPRIDVAGYFLDLIGKRRDQPGEDLVSGLVGAEVDGERLSDVDVLALCTLLFVAGSETTMNAISGGLLAFIEHPQERARLDDDGSLWPSMVEEVLRYVSPVLVGMVRTATDDVEVRDQTIRAGDKVTLWYPSANRDEEVFSDPDRIDVGRRPNPHVMFGAAPHFCLGASLARLEIRVTFEELFARAETIELAGEPKRLRSNVFAGLEELPVRVRAR